jgi:hypothetical protein
MLFLALVCFGVLASSHAVAARRPVDDLLGIRVGMDDREARRRLLTIGTPVTKLESPKQTWNLRDRRYGSLTIRYDSEWRVLWMTVFARPDGRRVAYRDIGDLEQAHRGGSYVYTWTLPLKKEGKPAAITARGPDPKYLSSVSIHPPGPTSPRPTNQTSH